MLGFIEDDYVCNVNFWFFSVLVHSQSSHFFITYIPFITCSHYYSIQSSYDIVDIGVSFPKVNSYQFRLYPYHD